MDDMGPQNILVFQYKYDKEDKVIWKIADFWTRQVPQFKH